MSKENICVFNEHEVCSWQGRLGRAGCGGAGVGGDDPGGWAQKH